MKIKYTKHAKKKFADLKVFGIIVTKSKIAETIKNPKYRSFDNGNPVIAADFDKRHNLRVVYKRSLRSSSLDKLGTAGLMKEKDDIIIITFYIYRKGRYGEN